MPSVDSTTGEVVFPLGAYFTTLASAQKFYNAVNLSPQTIFSESAGLSVSASSLEPLYCLSDTFCSKIILPRCILLLLSMYECSFLPCSMTLAEHQMCSY